MNGIVITIFTGIAIFVGLRTEFAIGLLVVLTINVIMINEYKKIRTLLYSGGKLKSFSHDNKEEVIDLQSLKSIVLTGGYISNFYIYKIAYENDEKQKKTFLTVPLRDDGFNNLLDDIKTLNKEVKIKRQFLS